MRSTASLLPSSGTYNRQARTIFSADNLVNTIAIHVRGFKRTLCASVSGVEINEKFPQIFLLGVGLRHYPWTVLISLACPWMLGSLPES